MWMNAKELHLNLHNVILYNNNMHKIFLSKHTPTGTRVHVAQSVSQCSFPCHLWAIIHVFPCRLLYGGGGWGHKKSPTHSLHYVCMRCSMGWGGYFCRELVPNPCGNMHIRYATKYVHAVILWLTTIQVCIHPRIVFSNLLCPSQKKS